GPSRTAGPGRRARRRLAGSGTPPSRGPARRRRRPAAAGRAVPADLARRVGRSTAMTQKMRRPDLNAELTPLKDFQRRTVERVHQQFWHPTDHTRKFLVADEVGLGKTLVARGVIAKTIDHLWDTVPRIDVVYICSNSQIARQNLPKLRIGEGVAERH